jgi:FlaA1/EpsC-like NDP-sugar epimerase
MIRAVLLGDSSWRKRVTVGIKSSGTVRIVDVCERVEDVSTENVDVVYISSGMVECWRYAETLIAKGLSVQIIPKGKDPTSYVKDEKLIERLLVSGLIRPYEKCSEDDGSFIKDKHVMITGAGGSIGSDLASKVIQFNPAHLTLIDNSENGVYKVDLEMNIAGFTSRSPIVADIRNERRVRAIMENKRPDIVFHIAARKHVPLMETHPEEAVSTNIGGTLTVLREAGRIGTGLFTFISTDKAADPANIMGASKRIAERIIQRYSGSDMKRCVVRFENVLDSAGNVVYTFLRQLRRGRALTVTSKEMNRFFITRDHASHFIIKASKLASDGEIFVPDAGPPINIDMLAKTIGSLMGFKEGRDFNIIYTKPRPGEKLSEKLITTEEEKRQKKLDGLFLIPPSVDENPDFEKDLERLLELADRFDRRGVRELMEKMEPTL